MIYSDSSTKRCLMAAAILLATISAADPAAAQQQAEQDAIAAGARAYGDLCGRCHNPRSPLERTDRDWVTIAAHMRVRGNLTGEQTRNVLAFLQATNGDPSQPAPLSGAMGDTVPTAAAAQDTTISTDPDVIARGEDLVAQRACLGCHVIGSAGGDVGPSLNDVITRKGAVFVRRKIADPTFDTSTSMMPNLSLKPEEIEAILAYINSLSERK